MDKKLVGKLGAAMASANMATAEINKRILIQHIKDQKVNVRSMMPNQGGVLMEAGYQVAETEVGISNRLYYVKPINKGEHFQPLIKKAMTGPFASAMPINKQHHWEFVFIWVEK